MIHVGRPLLLTGGVHIGARALFDIHFIWFGYIACLSQWGGGGILFVSNDFYLPSLRLRGGGAPCGTNQQCLIGVVRLHIYVYTWK
jgi:hypothetical protein